VSDSNCQPDGTGPKPSANGAGHKPQIEGGWYRMPNQVTSEDGRGLNPFQLAVFHVLAKRLSLIESGLKRPDYWPTFEQIAQEARMSRSQVIAVSKQFKEAGVVKVTGRTSHKASTYRLDVNRACGALLDAPPSGHTVPSDRPPGDLLDESKGHTVPPLIKTHNSKKETTSSPLTPLSGGDGEATLSETSFSNLAPDERAVVDAWNAHPNLPRVESVPKARHKRLREMLDDPGRRDLWRRALEVEKLKADIAAHAQREPIWVRREPIPDSTLHEHMLKIIDGRNRYRACRELGIEPERREWDGNGSLVAFVISQNLHRRHLDSGQRATVAVERLPLLEAEAKERQRAAGGDKRGVGAEVTQPDGARRSPEGREVRPTDSVGPEAVRQKADQAPQALEAEQPGRDGNAGKAAEQAAKLTGTNRQYVADAKKLKEQDPQTFEEVKTGKMKLKEATARLKANKPASAQERRLRQQEAAKKQEKRQAAKDRKRIADALSRLDADTRRALGDHEITRQVQVVYLANISQMDERLATAKLLVRGEVGNVGEARQRLVDIGVEVVLSRAEGPAPGGPP
jgi:hypothetical protein